jgi:hypothetical protein
MNPPFTFTKGTAEGGFLTLDVFSQVLYRDIVMMYVVAHGIAVTEDIISMFKRYGKMSIAINLNS